jgi:hypothetical protein
VKFFFRCLIVVLVTTGALSVYAQPLSKAEAICVAGVITWKERIPEAREGCKGISEAEALCVAGVMRGELQRDQGQVSLGDVREGCKGISEAEAICVAGGMKKQWANTLREVRNLCQ